MQQVIARFDKFLASIDSRLREVLAEAHQGCLQLFDESDLDPGPMGNAWTAMESRAKKLGSKVQDVWDDKVENDLEDADAPPEVRHQLHTKMRSLQEHIEVETERMRVTVYSAAARKLWERALAEAPKQVNCTQCGGAFEAPKVVASTNVTCPFCSAVNTYEPGMRARMIEHFCAQPLTEEACWSEWMEMRQAENNLHAQRDATLAHFQTFERAQINYWTKFFQVRANMLPHYAQNQQADVRGRMQYYYDRIHNEGVWAQAGRPRMLA